MFEACLDPIEVLTVLDYSRPRSLEQFKELEQAGMLAWRGRKLQPAMPVAQTRGDKTVAAMLLEDRK